MRGEWLRQRRDNNSVVFVHGILSDQDSCWRSANGTYWPELLASDPAVSSTGIYVFSYQSNVFSASYRLGDVVDALKEHLRLDHVLDSPRIIFVCHSMGGIAGRKFLVERCADLIDRGTEIGLFLLASPSLGSSYATWLNPLAQFLGHAQADALRFARSNAWLSDLDKEFQNLKESGKLSIKGKELVEDKLVVLRQFFRRQVVEPFSGARYFGEPFKVPGSDHFSIAKPENTDAIQHRLLVQFIRDMGENPAPVRTSHQHEIATPTEASKLTAGMRTGEYDRWHDDLNQGRLELMLYPADAVEVSILSRILNTVLLQHGFSETLIGNAHVVLWELLTNVARHVRQSEARVEIEFNKRHLPVVIVEVGDTGAGYDIWTIAEEQYSRMKTEREHGLGRICRLSDLVLPLGGGDSLTLFRVRCTFYDIAWPGCLCDEHAWCGKVILDYTSPASVWFGRRHYPLWWHFKEEQVMLREWAALGVLDFALDHGVSQIFELYLEQLAAADFRYLFFEIRGHGGTEAGPRSSAETIAQTLEAHFAGYFAAKKVFLYSSRNAYVHEMKELGRKYDIPFYVSEKECIAAVKAAARHIKSGS